jgi:hypothetical protein
MYLTKIFFKSLVTLDWIEQTQIGKQILNEQNKIHLKKF